MSATSVLDASRVAGVLKILKPARRRLALQGLQLLANASLQFSSPKGRNEKPQRREKLRWEN